MVAEAVLPAEAGCGVSNRRKQYGLYVDLCDRLGVEPRNTRWVEHHDQLVDGRRLSREELQAWWTERLSPDEILEIASALDFLSTEVTA